MFVVTGLHTKRRPHLSTDGSRTTIGKHFRKGLSLLPAVPQLHQHLLSVKPPVSIPSDRHTPHASKPRMAQIDGDTDARDRNEKGRHPKVPPKRVARDRKFIPKPLILVERMKTRQLVLQSPPLVVSKSCIAPGWLTCSKTVMTTPLTPLTRQVPTWDTLQPSPRLSSDVSFLMSSCNNILHGSGFRMAPRPVRPPSLVTLDDRSSSTDTFVADSPCFVKQTSSNVPLLITESDPIDAYPNAESHTGKKSVSNAYIPVPFGSGSADLGHRTCHSIDGFEPAKTSTPFASSQATTNGVPSPIKFATTTLFPTYLPEQAVGPTESSEIKSLTSRAIYPFNVASDALVVKLPNFASADSLSNRTRLPSPSRSKVIKADTPSPEFAKIHKPTFDPKRPSNRIVSPSPTLVLDGVFALPRPTPPSLVSPRSALKGFPRPRKPLSRRQLNNRANAPAVAVPSQPPSPLDATVTVTSTTSRSLCGPPGPSIPESPRSMLAHVLTANPQSQTTRQLARVPPLVKGVEVSIDSRTQCEIKGLRVRRVVGLGRGDGGMDNGVSIGGGCDGKGSIERMSLASIGMVAKLRARWETGASASCD